MSCSAIPTSTKCDGCSSSTVRTRQSDARSASRTTTLRMTRDELEQLLAVGSGDVLVGHAARVPAPDSGSPSRRDTLLERRNRLRAGGPAGAARCDRRARRVRAQTPRRRARPRASGRCRRLREAPRVFHERHAAALDRVRDEDLRHIVGRRAHRCERATRAHRGRARRTTSTCQPNARSFASRSPSARISSVGRSDCSSFRSTIAHRLPTRWCAADASASQFCPSCSSPSPVITTTTPPRPR